MPKKDEDLIGTVEAARVLGLKRNMARRHFTTGVVASARKIGRDWFAPRSAVEAAKGRKTDPGPAARQ